MAESAHVTRLIYFYLDPVKIWLPLERGAPRLFFEDAALWDTVLKLKRLIESPVPDDWAYLEALGAVLAHEVVRLDRGMPGIRCRAQGGSSRVAATARHRLYRGTSRRTNPTRDAGTACLPKPLLLLSGFQAILGCAPTPISHHATNRARQDAISEASYFGDGHWTDGGLQRHQLLHGGISQDNRDYADRLSPQSLLDTQKGREACDRTRSNERGVQLMSQTTPRCDSKYASPAGIPAREGNDLRSAKRCFGRARARSTRRALACDGP